MRTGARGLALIVLIVLAACTITQPANSPAPLALNAGPTATSAPAPTFAPTATTTLVQAINVITATATSAPTSTTAPPTNTATVPPIATPATPPGQGPPLGAPTGIIVPTVTLAPPTSTATVISAAYYAEYFASRKRQLRSGSPLAADVTGDGLPEQIFISWVDTGCGASHCSSTEFLTVFSSATVLLDAELNGVLYVPSYTVTPARDGLGFTVVQAATTGLSNTWGYRWTGTALAIMSTASTPPRPTQIPASATYRAQNTTAANLILGAATETNSCLLDTSTACVAALGRGGASLDQAASILNATTPPPNCTTLHFLATQWLAAQRSFYAKVRTYGPSYNAADILIGTQREVAAVNDAKNRWNYEYQNGACR